MQRSPLEEHLKRKIEETTQGWIPFSAWMEEVLYHPQWGYYKSEAVRVGKSGDFYTNAQVHQIFGQMLARELVHRMRTMPPRAWRLLELGAGTGELCRNILKAMRHEAPDVFGQLSVIAVEGSPGHRHAFRKNLEQSLAPKVEVVNSLEEVGRPFEGVVLAHEFFDALPVDLLRFHNQSWWQMGVSWAEPRGFVMAWQPPGQELLAELEHRDPPLEEGVMAEISLAVKQVYQQLSELMASGYLLVVDYGHLDRQMWLERCLTGSLRTYRRHQLGRSPLQMAGEQDITYDVYFPELVRWGQQFGFSFQLLEDQRTFLLRRGILEHLVDGASHPFSPEARRNRAIRHLVWDEWGMGSRFGCLIQKKEHK